MILVGIREAKNNLATFVRLALAGEEVVVTRRGKRVARIVPFAAREADVSRTLSAQAPGDE